MKSEAHAILKRAISDHRDTLLKDRLSCLGILRDFEGRDHSEIYLLADAVDQQIHCRLMVNQPVTDRLINQIADDFARCKSLKFDDARFAVESWADALSLYYLDPSKYADHDNEACNENDEQHWSGDAATHQSEPQWSYYENDSQMGPVSESTIKSLIRSGKIRRFTLVWRSGMSRWEPAEENFADAFIPRSSSSVSATSFKTNCSHCNQPIEAPLHLLGTVVTCPSCSTPFTAGQGHSDSAPPPVPKLPPLQNTKHYGGIRRGKFIAIIFGVSLLFAIFQGASAKGDGTATVLLNIVMMFPVYFRLKNTGKNPWWCLTNWIPILGIYPWYISLFCQEGYAESKKLDKAGKTALWILLGIFVLGIMAAIAIPNLK